MKKPLFTVSFLVLFLFMIANTTSTFAAQASTHASKVTAFNGSAYSEVHACEQAPIGFAHCLAIVLKPIGINPSATKNTQAGLTPHNLQKAYKLPSATAG